MSERSKMQGDADADLIPTPTHGHVVNHNHVAVHEPKSILASSATPVLDSDRAQLVKYISPMDFKKHFVAGTPQSKHESPAQPRTPQASDSLAELPVELILMIFESSNPLGRRFLAATSSVFRATYKKRFIEESTKLVIRAKYLMRPLRSAPPYVSAFNGSQAFQVAVSRLFPNYLGKTEELRLAKFNRHVGIWYKVNGTLEMSVILDYGGGVIVDFYAKTRIGLLSHLAGEA